MNHITSKIFLLNSCASEGQKPTKDYFDQSSRKRETFT